MARTKQVPRKSTGGLGLGRPFQLWSQDRQPLATPAPSEARSTTTPVTESTETKDQHMEDAVPAPPVLTDKQRTPVAPPRKHYPKRTFKQQQHNDRKAAKKRIREVIDELEEEQEWKPKGLEERKSIIEDEYRGLMKERANDGRQGSAKSDFPAQHDEEFELRWLMYTFSHCLKHEPANVERTVARSSSVGTAGSDDMEVIPENEIAVETKREPEDEEQTPSATDVESEEKGGRESTPTAETRAKLAGWRKRGLSETEAELERKGKRMRVGHGGQITHKAAEQAGKEEVLCVAVSRGMVISEVSKAKGERADAGWPWAMAGKTGALGGGE